MFSIKEHLQSMCAAWAEDALMTKFRQRLCFSRVYILIGKIGHQLNNHMI